MTAPNVPPQAPVRRKANWLTWLKRIGIAAILLIALIVIAIPYLASSSFVKNRVVREIESKLHAKVSVESVQFSWFKGIDLVGLRVANPPGFPEGDAVRVGSMHADWSWKRLLGGGIQVRAVVSEPELNVDVDEHGRINLQELTQQPTPGSADDDAPPSRSSEGGANRRQKSFQVQLAFALERGRVRIVDRQRHIQQELRGIEVRVGNDAAGAPLAISCNAKLGTPGAADTGTIDVTAKADLNAAMPLAQFRFETSGVDLAHYEALVAAYVPERFESFRGRIAGSLSANSENGAPRLKLAGDLRIEDLDVRGGPLQPGRGFVAKRWTIRPAAQIDLDKKTGSITGTEIDLGFAKITALDATRTRALFANNATRAPLGLLLTIDLAKLAEQPILPKGKWAGTIETQVGVVLEDDGTIPFASRTEAKGLVAEGAMPEGARIPRLIKLLANGRVLRGESMQLDGNWLMTSDGIDAHGKFAVANAWSANVDAKLDPTASSTWLAPWLPTGMQLTGAAQVLAKAGGPLTKAASGSDKNGGLLAAAMSAEGEIRAPRVQWLGNDLDGAIQKFSLAGGKFAVTSPGGAKLNGGPLSFGCNVAGLLSKARKLDFSLEWDGGKAGGGLTPLLQYAVPLLAGLPTDDITKVGGIQFDSTIGFTLKGGGPMPAEGGSWLEALAKWNMDGNLSLANGSFSPSQAMNRLFKFFENKTRIRFDNIKTKVHIQDGKVWTQGFRMGGKDGVLTLSGSTSLAGALDFKVDFTDILAKHRDGQRILAALGKQRVALDLAGSLWTPSIHVQDFVQKAVQGALENAAGNLLKDLQKGKNPAKAFKDLLRGFGGKKK